MLVKYMPVEITNTETQEVQEAKAYMIPDDMTVQDFLDKMMGLK